MKKQFKMSALDILKDDPDFKFVKKDKNGVPVFELKKKDICEICGGDGSTCDEHDELFV